jgi:hypothetical protein
MTKSNAVTFEQYKAAADRIRRGQARMGDEAICDRYDAQELAKPALIYHKHYELPIMVGMWDAEKKNA